MNGQVEVVALLLKSGASVEAQNDNGDGPRTDGTTMWNSVSITCESKLVLLSQFKSTSKLE